MLIRPSLLRSIAIELCACRVERSLQMNIVGIRNISLLNAIV
ncbi:hypothetical protein GCWU000325_00652 [Alloprevotella tannerae ATCC 51259]|uniref:Uncharacterized protein n=1 Tax=Alloprevotella tannerae ATCC 51259 TaxID=626522 RepID=C9LEM2_9BACT|nr:hypothetical protein GCWU000325_00652 [Alloprevotella tannerae ATCC 51259]